jgi:hypothetical protein
MPTIYNWTPSTLVGGGAGIPTSQTLNIGDSFVVYLGNPGVFGGVWNANPPSTTGGNSQILNNVSGTNNFGIGGTVNILTDGRVTNSTSAIYFLNVSFTSTTPSQNNYFRFTYQVANVTRPILSLQTFATLAEALGQSQSSAPCFSKQTLEKIIPSISEKKSPYVLVKSLRNNKKMYRCNYHPYGTIEFTNDHPFIYKNKIYPFEELIKVHPILKQSAKEIPLDDENCSANSYVYNVIGDINQLSQNNTFSFGPNLFMLGGTYSNKLSYIKYKKQAEIMENVLKASDNDTSYLSKYTCIHNYIENNDDYGEEVMMLM